MLRIFIFLFFSCLSSICHAQSFYNFPKQQQAPASTPSFSSEEYKKRVDELGKQNQEKLQQQVQQQLPKQLPVTITTPGKITPPAAGKNTGVIPPPAAPVTITAPAAVEQTPVTESKPELPPLSNAPAKSEQSQIYTGYSNPDTKEKNQQSTSPNNQSAGWKIQY